MPAARAAATAVRMSASSEGSSRNPWTQIWAPTPWPAASRNAAQAIGVDDRKGTLEPGKDADLVLLDLALRVVVTIAEGAVVHGNDRLAGG